MDGRLDVFPGLLVGADRMHRVSHGLQGLEGDHGFVVLAVVATDHQNLLASHVLAPSEKVRGSEQDRKSTRLNSSHSQISYAVFCLKKKKKKKKKMTTTTRRNI